MGKIDIILWIVAIITNNWKNNALSSILLILTSVSIGINIDRYWQGKHEKEGRFLK